MPAQGGADQPEEDGPDTGPLSSIHIEPAEEGGNIITHEPKVPARVKEMGLAHLKPRKHVVKNQKELEDHIHKHGPRLKP